MLMLKLPTTELRLSNNCKSYVVNYTSFRLFDGTSRKLQQNYRALKFISNVDVICNMFVIDSC